MLKFLIFLILAYIAYRLFVGPPLLDPGKAKQQIREQEPDEEEFTDYEEIE